MDIRWLGTQLGQPVSNTKMGPEKRSASPPHVYDRLLFAGYNVGSTIGVTGLRNAIHMVARAVHAPQ